MSARSTEASGIKYLAQGYTRKNFNRHWVGSSDLSIVIPALHRNIYIYISRYLSKITLAHCMWPRYATVSSHPLILLLQ